MRRPSLMVVMVIWLLLVACSAEPAPCPSPTAAAEPPAAVVPTDLAPTDSCRIAFDDGHPYVRDRLVVGLKLDLPDPDSLILAIAQRHGARVEGAISRAAMYQLQFPDVPSREALEAIRQRLLTEPDVDFASTSYLMPHPAN